MVTKANLYTLEFFSWVLLVDFSFFTCSAIWLENFVLVGNYIIWKTLRTIVLYMENLFVYHQSLVPSITSYSHFLWNLKLSLLTRADVPALPNFSKQLILSWAPCYLYCTPGSSVPIFFCSLDMWLGSKSMGLLPYKFYSSHWHKLCSKYSTTPIKTNSNYYHFIPFSNNAPS